MFTKLIPPNEIYAHMAQLDDGEPMVDAYPQDYPDSKVKLTKYIRADLVQHPFIEGLDEALKKATHPGHRFHLLMHPDDKPDFNKIVAAHLYAQGQRAQPVDLDALKREIEFNCDEPDFDASWIIDLFEKRLSSRGMIGQVKKPTEAAQLALDGLNKLKVNDHSGSPEDYGDDVGFENSEQVSDWVNQNYKIIRAALEQKAGSDV